MKIAKNCQINWKIVVFCGIIKEWYNCIVGGRSLPKGGDWAMVELVTLTLTIFSVLLGFLSIVVGVYAICQKK